MAADGLAARARALLQRYRDRQPASDQDKAIYAALERLASERSGGAGDGGTPDWFLPLLGPGPTGTGASATCWPGTGLDADALLPALFWLDLLSTDETLSLTSFPAPEQIILLDAALDPDGVAACAKASPTVSRAASHSLYLLEVSRNPGFVRFVTRALPRVSLDLGGASLGHDRFVVTRAGLKFYEGAAPDRASRIVLVGELGIVIETKGGLSVDIFEPDISWTMLP